MALALIIVTRKLRPYFLAHPIIVLTNQPLKKILQSSEASGRLIKWAIELSDFGIEHQPRSPVEAQVLADFVVDGSSVATSTSPPTWILYTNGSATSTRNGAEIVLTSPQRDRVEYAMKFGFPASNNEAEYEALIVGMKLARAAGARRLLAHCDSQLVVQKVERAFEAKDVKMAEYKKKEGVAKFKEEFQGFTLTQVPRGENPEADKLAKLANSMARITSQKITLLVCDHPETASRHSKKGNQLELLDVRQSKESWMDLIVNYIQEDRLPSDQKEARTLRMRAAHFIIIDGQLYTMGFSQPYLKCLAPKRANYVMRKILERICATTLAANYLSLKFCDRDTFGPL